MILDPQRFPQVRNPAYKRLSRIQFRRASRKFMGANYGACPKCSYPKLIGFSCRLCGVMHSGKQIS